MSLIDDVKVALRVTSDAFDPEVEMLVEAALRDLQRVGIPDEFLVDGPTDPLVRAAVCMYAKAHFGFDNSEAPRFDESYRQIVKDFLNSPTSYSDRKGGTPAAHEMAEMEGL